MLALKSSSSGIPDNEIADTLAKTTASIRLPPNNLIPWSDFCPKLNFYIKQLWFDSHKNRPPHFATWYRSINRTISLDPWFHKLNLSRKTISSFSRLRFGHTSLTFLRIILKRFTPLYFS